MEETKETSPKLTYEQLEQAAMQLQQRLMMAESRLRGIDFASVRLTWLFKVIENKGAFPAEFFSKCAKEVEDLLTIENLPTTKKSTPDEQSEKID